MSADGLRRSLTRHCCHGCYDVKYADDRMALLCRPMIVCVECGNKRCPHATDHTLACTDSNDPGQYGSLFQ